MGQKSSAPSLEILGWAASAILVGAFWLRGDRQLFWTLLVGLSVMAVHQAGMGAATAAAGFTLGALRMLAAIRWPRSAALTAIFCLASLVSATLTWSGPVSALAAAGGIGTTLALHLFAGRALRLSLLPVNVVWIAHHLIVGSTPSLLLEVAVMAGNAATAWRLSAEARRPLAQGWRSMFPSRGPRAPHARPAQA